MAENGCQGREVDTRLRQLSRNRVPDSVANVVYSRRISKRLGPGGPIFIEKGLHKRLHTFIANCLNSPDYQHRG